jgi:hypothetical protein
MLGRGIFVFLVLNGKGILGQGTFLPKEILKDSEDNEESLESNVSEEEIDDDTDGFFDFDFGNLRDIG